MPIAPVTEQSWLFVPPLDMPLSLRLENGRFGSLRRRALPVPPLCATTQVIPGPTGEDVHFATGIHPAVNLASVAGNCVYAAYSGRVVKLEVQPGGDTANISIDHHPRGLGFLTNYNHIAEVRVGVGDFVGEGEPVAQVSAVPDEPTLHFELWAVIDRGDRGRDDAPGNSDMVPIDPTRPLYAWEQQLVPDEPVAGLSVPETIGVARIHTVPFFVASLETGLRLHVPMYEPMTTDERFIVRLLREAHRRGAGLELSVRHSSFWGVDVITQAQLG